MRHWLHLIRKFSAMLVSVGIIRFKCHNGGRKPEVGGRKKDGALRNRGWKSEVKVVVGSQWFGSWRLENRDRRFIDGERKGKVVI